MALERTYIMIKPNAVAERHVGDIIARIERTGLSIERMELAVLTEEQAEANYAEHVEKPFFRELVDFITSGPVVKMVVSGESAIKKMRTLMGATNPIDAAPGTIRGDFGLDVAANVIHGSDSPEAAEREIALFFGEELNVTERIERLLRTRALNRFLFLGQGNNAPKDGKRFIVLVRGFLLTSGCIKRDCTPFSGYVLLKQKPGRVPMCNGTRPGVWLAFGYA